MKQWTPEERAIAVGMKRAGLIAPVIAKRLGRSVSSVKKQLVKAGARAPKVVDRANPSAIPAGRIALSMRTTGEDHEDGL